MNLVHLALTLMIPHHEIVYLIQLLSLKMQTLINMDIMVMELDLIEQEVFRFQLVDLVKMY